MARLSLSDPHQKAIYSMIRDLSGKWSTYQIWGDMIHMSAIAISNTVDLIHAEDREKAYKRYAEKYSEAELRKLSECFYEIVNALEDKPDQDFLGDLFMRMEFGSDAHGQVFTPYSVCRMMAEISDMTKLQTDISELGWVAVNDPAVGGGALLIAFANACKERSIDFQNHVMFIGQDIDSLVANMAYIQISLLGCPGYIVVGNTLSSPQLAHDKRGLLPDLTKNDIWFTPMFMNEVWTTRKLIARWSILQGGTNDTHRGSTEEDA